MCAIFCVHDMMRLAALAAPFLTTQLLLKIAMTSYRTIEDYIGNTPLVRVERIAELGDNILLLKLEGNNPAGSVKDRPAISMIKHAQERGDIRPGDTLIEATSGNTGIALAMAATVRGYRIILIMPESASLERRALMKAFGAEILLVSKEAGMEGARDLALEMQRQGKGIVLNQFANPDNPRAHYEGTGPEIWSGTGGRITHFVSSMGTTGTIMGTSRYLKERNPGIQVIGVQPTAGSAIPGIRRWPPQYVPEIFDASRVDRVMDVSQAEAEEMARRLASREGIFCGISSGGAVAAAIRLCADLRNATVVTIVCDRGDRYVSTNVFPA
jgi:S-sulfo-L-cysteine synthase (O-acetyl-L-serine-dependent)